MTSHQLTPPVTDMNRVSTVWGHGGKPDSQWPNGRVIHRRHADVLCGTLLEDHAKHVDDPHDTNERPDKWHGGGHDGEEHQPQGPEKSRGPERGGPCAEFS